MSQESYLQGNFARARHELKELCPICLVKTPQSSPEPKSQMLSPVYPPHNLLPNYLQTRGGVLVVLGVGLKVVNVDVGEAGQQKLQLLLVEDSDQSKNEIIVIQNLTTFWLFTFWE